MNPFDPNQERQEHHLFNRITIAINEWMLKKYPEFDNSLIHKLRQVEIEHGKIKALINQHEASWEKAKKDAMQKCIEQINDFIEKEHPDISNNLKASAMKIQKHADMLDKRIGAIDKKLAECVKSDNLYKDVYDLRDEFKKIQKFMDTFQSRVKKAFDI
jgi:endonuclease IV